jgi:hypothetical protein
MECSGMQAAPLQRTGLGNRRPDIEKLNTERKNIGITLRK